jgi:hypothetical protein
MLSGAMVVPPSYLQIDSLRYELERVRSGPAWIKTCTIA